MQRVEHCFAVTGSLRVKLPKLCWLSLFEGGLFSKAKDYSLLGHYKDALGVVQFVGKILYVAFIFRYFILRVPSKIYC